MPYKNPKSQDQHRRRSHNESTDMGLQHFFFRRDDSPVVVVVVDVVDVVSEVAAAAVIVVVAVEVLIEYSSARLQVTLVRVPSWLQ